MTTEDCIRARERADVTQDEIAAEMRISRSSIQRFEYGIYPLPRSRTISDYFEAIAAIKARRAAQREQQAS